jgi:PKD repeat protein
LSSGSGAKTVYFKVRNASGTQSATKTDSILVE